MPTSDDRSQAQLPDNQDGLNLSGYLKLYAAMLPVFFAVDMLWLGVVADTFYRSRLGHLLAPEVNWPAALTFYLIYIAGILIFAVAPGLRAASLNKTLLLAAGFGFFTYETYELTNMATLPGWPISVVVVDSIWGVVLCTIVAAAGFTVGRRIATV
jgi:uncharacterized membrane protein